MEILRRFVREMLHVTDAALIMSFSVLMLIGIGLIVYWRYNRRKFHELTHQIPASVVKNYLDTIITNSNALKSSLFRGGGLELGQGIPSVFPTQDLPSGNVGEGDSEALNQKNAEINALKKEVQDKNDQLSDLQTQYENLQSTKGAEGGADPGALNDLKSQVGQLEGQLAEAQKQLEEAKAAGGGGGGDDSALQGQLSEVTKERDELKERLMEYEIIEEDLANLKRLQQENDQLKNQLAALQGGAAPADATPAAEAAPEPAAEAAPEPAAEPAPEPAAEAAPEPAAEAAPAEDDLEAQMAAAIQEQPAAEPAGDATPEAPAAEEPQAEEGEQKSAEELLSEFEKMLG